MAQYNNNSIIRGVVFDIPVIDYIFPKRESLSHITNNKELSQLYENILSFYRERYQSGKTYTFTDDEKQKILPLVQSFYKKAHLLGIDLMGCGGSGYNKLSSILPLLSEAGFQVSASMIGVVGNDQEGAFLQKQMKAQNITLLSQKIFSENTKISIVLPYDNDRTVTKCNFIMPEGLYDNSKFLEATLRDATFIILESKLWKYTTPESYRAFLEALPEETIVAFAPPAEGKLPPISIQAAQRADVLLLNADEAVQVFSEIDSTTKIVDWQHPSFQNALARIKKDILKKETDVVIITHSSLGSLAITKKHEVYYALKPSQIVSSEEIENTLGAGDAYAGTFLAFYIKHRLEKKDITQEFLEKTMEAASNVASAVIMQPQAQLDSNLVVNAAAGEVPTHGALLKADILSKKKYNAVTL